MTSQNVTDNIRTSEADQYARPIGDPVSTMPPTPVHQPDSVAPCRVLDERARQLFMAGEGLQLLGTGTTWCEGPVWMPRDQCLLYSDIPANRMMVWSAAQGLRVWREAVEFTNGHALEADGSLLHCSHGQRAITRTRFGPRGVAGAGGPVAQRDCVDEIVVDRHAGGRLNSPNDVVVKSDASIWFTDPPYGILSDREGHKAPSEQAHHHVFRLDPASGHLRAMTHWVEEPNGLAFSPDESVLYVSDTSAALRTDGSGHHHIVRFNVGIDDELSSPEVVRVIRPGLADGFRVDQRGWIYTSSQDSVQVLAPDGIMLAQIMVPEKVGNLCFGGARGNELFICASTSLYRIRLNAQSGVRLHAHSVNHA
jgi:gluconolactonase